MDRAIALDQKDQASDL
jgi:hypothetical protein